MVAGCIVEAAKLHAQELLKSNDPSHDWHHVERVYKNAVYLADKEKENKPDMEIVELAALFHDAVDFKYDHDKGKSLEVIAHERLDEFFGRFKYPEAKVNAVIDIILNISWRKELEQKTSNGVKKPSIELGIVRDADRLDAIGAVGVARCFAYSGAKMRPLYLEGLKPVENMTAEQYNAQATRNESTAVNHFYEKLLLIKDKMNTQSGRKMAEQRHQFMLEYLKQFEAEVKPETSGLL